MSRFKQSPSALAAAMAALLCAPGMVAAALAQAPPADPAANCFDGGQPYRVGAHLCTSAGIVEICLRPNQSYGLHGAYLYEGKDKAGLHFDKAHWVSTTSTRCSNADRGRVYY
jgi:hypothetical protein